MQELPWEVLSECVHVLQLDSDTIVTVIRRDSVLNDIVVAIYPVAPIFTKLREELIPALSVTAEQARKYGATCEWEPTVGRGDH